MNIRTMAVAFSQKSLPFDLNTLYCCLSGVCDWRDQTEWSAPKKSRPLRL